MQQFVLTLVLLGAVAVGGLPSSKQEPTDAAKTYAGKCAMCHGATGAGDGAAAAAFDPKPTNFATAEYQASRTDEQIAAAITSGKGAMPGFKGQLSAEEIKQLVAYLRSFGPTQP